MGVPVAVIGDYELIPKVRGKIHHAFEKAGIKQGEIGGYELLDVLTEYIDVYSGWAFTDAKGLSLFKGFTHWYVLSERPRNIFLRETITQI